MGKTNFSSNQNQQRSTQDCRLSTSISLYAGPSPLLSMPSTLRNDVSSDESVIIVASTRISTMLCNSLAFQLSICKLKAKAMAPLISPLYQQTMSYLVSRGNFFPKMQQKQGSRKTAANLAMMTIGIIRTLQAIVSHSPLTLKIDSPRQANTKAQARYPTVSKVTPVTCLEQLEMFKQQQWPVIIPHTNKEIIPERPAIQLTKQAKQLTRTISEIYLTGLYVRSTFLKKKDKPNPKAIPISSEHEKRYRKSREIQRLVMPKEESLFIELVTDLNRMIAVASFIMPSPNNTLFRTGQSSCLMRVRAATESVAQSTAERKSASERVS